MKAQKAKQTMAKFLAWRHSGTVSAALALGVGLYYLRPSTPTYILAAAVLAVAGLLNEWN